MISKWWALGSSCLLLWCRSALADEQDPIATVTGSAGTSGFTSSITAGTMYVVQCNVEVYYKSCQEAVSTCAATANNLRLPKTPFAFIVMPRNGVDKLAFFSEQAFTCRIYDSIPRVVPIGAASRGS